MIQLHKSRDGKFFFIVLAKNGRVLATSQMYTRKERANEGAMSLCILLNDGVEVVNKTKE